MRSLWDLCLSPLRSTPAELTASHFGGGGGLLRKKGPGEKGDKGRSRQELIDELIIKSKQEKVSSCFSMRVIVLIPVFIRIAVSASVEYL